MTAAATRRAVLGAAAAAVPFSRPARAQQPRWEPSRPINVLVGFAPGGGTDIISRLLQPVLQTDLGQPVTVENRPGASGTVAALAGTRAPPDGHTLFMTTVSASAVVPPHMNPPPFDIYRDQTSIVLAATVPLVVVVPVSSPARDLRGLVEHARANPGKLNYSSSGVATQQHLAAELLAARAGARMTHVPFRGTGQAVNEILAGRIDLAIDTFPTYLPHIREGRVRALATTMPRRIEWLPDLPTVAETRVPGFDAPDFDANVWYMLMGPAGLPAAATERLAAAVNRALNDPTLRPRIRDAGFIPGGGTSADAAALLRRDAERYAALIRAAGIRME
jgi:tripartite-type tricarboxylate transporter receptor subunit TctC